MPDTTNRLGGVINFTCDGVPYFIRGNMKVTLGGVKREAVVGQDGVHGYTEMPISPSIEGEFTTRPGLSIARMQDITNSTITAQLANGSTYVLTQAWTEAAYEIETAEGKFNAKFCGMDGRELTI